MQICEKLVWTCLGVYVSCVLIIFACLSELNLSTAISCYVSPHRTLIPMRDFWDFLLLLSKKLSRSLIIRSCFADKQLFSTFWLISAPIPHWTLNVQAKSNCLNLQIRGPFLLSKHQSYKGFCLIGGYSADTLRCAPERSQIEPPTLQLANDLLCLLSRRLPGQGGKRKRKEIT